MSACLHASSHVCLHVCMPPPTSQRLNPPQPRATVHGAKTPGETREDRDRWILQSVDCGHKSCAA